MSIRSPMVPLGLVLALLLLVAGAPVTGSWDVGRPSPDQGPTEVQLEVFLLDLDAINSAEQSFEANVYFQATWTDPRLADPVRTHPVTRGLGEIWNPRLQILNQQRLWTTFPEIVEITPEGTVTQRQRVWGSFSQPLDLRQFPFDTQTIGIPVVAAEYGTDEVALVPSARSGIGETFSVADWKVASWKLVADYQMRGAADDQSAAIALFLEAERLQGYYWVKVIAPLVLIVAMSWAVFWIDPKDVGTKISITITAMLTLIAYRFAIGANLPTISYLTLMDYFIMVSTVLIYASLVTVVTTSALERKGNVTLAKRIDRVSRWSFPLFFIVSWIIIMLSPWA